jgi:plasmid maintenance system antidote protein VapI
MKRSGIRDVRDVFDIDRLLAELRSFYNDNDDVSYLDVERIFRISSVTVTRLLRDEPTTLNLETAVRLAHYFDISLDSLVRLTDQDIAA